jgi:hypothetical protein
MPMTSVRPHDLAVEAFRWDWWSAAWARCEVEKLMNASISGSASFMSLASFGIEGRSWSTTLRHCSLGRFCVVLRKGGGDEGEDHAPAALALHGQAHCA